MIIQRNARVRAVFAGILGLVFFMANPLASNATGGDESARAATQLVRDGKILPLATLLERLRPTIGDHILEVEFEQDDNRWIYEIYFLGENGRRNEVYVDAVTGQILAHKPAE